MRKGLAFLFLVALLLQGPTMGEAANWVKINETETNSLKKAWYIDTESIQINKSETREVWMKTTFDPPDPSTDHLGQKVYMRQALSFLVLKPEKYIRTQELVEYYTNGKSSSFTLKGDFTKIAPDTVGEVVWNFLFK